LIFLISFEASFEQDMKQYWVILGKALLPALFALVGLFIVIVGLGRENPQTIWYLLSGVSTLLASVLWMMLVFGKLSAKQPGKVALLFILPAFALSFLIYKSINNALEFQAKEIAHIKVVIERLTKIREAQLAYRDVHEQYAPTFEELLEFIKFGKYPVERRIGNADDSVAVAAGLVKIDTIYFDVLGYKFIETFPVDSLPFVPFAKDRIRFDMDAGFITSPEGIDMPVFAASTNYNVFLKDLYEMYGRLSVDSIIQVGSMAEPITTGNWRDIK
jgi:hypothetical protein